MAESWIAYVDETGSFERRDESSMVVGWLTPLSHEQVNEELAPTLDDVAPWLGWPLHASYIRRVSWHVLALMMLNRPMTPEWLSRTGGLCQQQLDSLVQRAGDFWWSKASTKEAFERCLTTLKQGREPDFEDVLALDAALKRAAQGDRDLLRVWKIGNTLEAACRKGLLQAFERYFKASSGAGTLVIGNAEYYEGANRSERYTRALQALVRGMLWTLLASAKTHVPRNLELAVAQLVLMDAETNARTLMRDRVLNQVLDAALSQDRRRHANDREVNVVQAKAYDFRKGDVAGLFVADLAANFLYRLLSEKPQSQLQSLEQMLKSRTGIGIKLAPASPYAAVSTGWFDHYIESAMDDLIPGIKPLETPGWVEESAIQWAEHFRQPGWKEAFR